MTKDDLEKLIYDGVQADIECEADAKNKYQSGYAVGFNDCRHRVLEALSPKIESDAKVIAALREALKPFATMAICAVRTLGDADTDMCLLVPLKYLDAARTALSNEQNVEK